MKKARYWILVAIFSTIFFGCGLIPQESDIIITNNSNYEIKSITLRYIHASDHVEKVIRINSLEQNKTWKTTVEIAKKSYMTYTTAIDIEYYIDDKKYDVDDHPYNNNNILASGRGVRFIIEDESYSVTRI